METYIACPPAPPSRCGVMSGLGEVLTFMGAVQMCRVRQGREHPAVLRCRELVQPGRYPPHCVTT